MASILTKETLRRLISDIKEIKKNPLTSHGIYYEHDDTEILKGKALIIGPKDTPYENGFYLFKFSFPLNYPHSPPTVTFSTTDDYTRFNPNLYRTGKVCLSILNTWQGEPWSGCQTISSILLALCTVLNNEPFLNEPGILRSNPDFDSYHSILRYKNIEIAILDTLENDAIKNEFGVFMEIMQEHFSKQKETLRETICEESKKDAVLAITSIYRLKVMIDYKSLLEKFDSFISLQK